MNGRWETGTVLEGLNAGIPRSCRKAFVLGALAFVPLRWR